MSKLSASGLIAALFVALVAGVAYVRYGSHDAGASVLVPDDAEVVARGDRLYAQHCAACHGAALEGQPGWRQRRADAKMPAPPHDATGHTWHHPDRMLVELTKVGPAALVGNGYASDMPGFDGVLSDADIVAVLSYIKSTWPTQVREHHDAINERASAR